VFRNGNSENFIKFIEIALENAEEIERHRDIRHLEALRESNLSEIPLTKFPLIEISPFAVFRVSQKVKTSLNSNPIKKATAKAVGGDGEAGFTPVAAPVIPKHFRASEMTEAPLSGTIKYRRVYLKTIISSRSVLVSYFPYSKIFNSYFYSKTTKCPAKRKRATSFKRSFIVANYFRTAGSVRNQLTGCRRSRPPTWYIGSGWDN